MYSIHVCFTIYYIHHIGFFIIQKLMIVSCRCFKGNTAENIHVPQEYMYEKPVLVITLECVLTVL